MTIQKLLRLAALTLLIASASTIASPQAAAPNPTPSQAEARVADTTKLLLSTYDRNNGLFQNDGWWNSANAFTTLADIARITHTTAFNPVLANTLIRAQTRFANFRNTFYDDEGWWALAWIDAYNVTHDKNFLKMAESIFSDMTGGWDNTCGGGIWWKKDRKYKNAIPNELFLKVAAQLAADTTGKEQATYLDWANKEWTWFAGSGMINEKGLVNDGLDPQCHNNHRTTWTYNQGVLIGGLVALNAVQPNPKTLDAATTLAGRAITGLSDANGILHDPCEPHCGGDAMQFKGILMRNLGELQQVAPDPKTSAFLIRNADSIWNTARTPDGWISERWTGPPFNSGPRALTSALDALTAALAESLRH